MNFVDTKALAMVEQEGLHLLAESAPCLLIDSYRKTRATERPGVEASRLAAPGASAGGAGGLSKSGVGAAAGYLCLVGVAADGEVVGVCFLKWVGFNFDWLSLYEAEEVGAFALKLIKRRLSWLIQFEI
ncbi:hypothetical protein L3X38_041332 [Prunus dulcis]|uniref:Uncharacterized protein n=1 Tax=Prunus dulcis TaxID=3755 RepID=A0AAD4YKI4_PRUDU|nr:hypothetical protein L3X38_041332 [Prunus dulcis]